MSYLFDRQVWCMDSFVYLYGCGLQAAGASEQLPKRIRSKFISNFTFSASTNKKKWNCTNKPEINKIIRKTEIRKLVKCENRKIRPNHTKLK